VKPNLECESSSDHFEISFNINADARIKIKDPKSNFFIVMFLQILKMNYKFHLT
jgi:hypothetical protein